MKTLYLAIAACTLAAGAPALSHPTDIPFASFGECQAALAKENKTDRILHADAFPNNGAAEIRMLDNWQCVYDPATEAWYMSGQPYGGDLLGNGNGKADPGNTEQ